MQEAAFSISEHIGELRARLKVVFLTFIIILVILIFFPANPLRSIQNPGQYFDLRFLENTVIAVFLQRIVSYILPPTWKLIAANGIGEGMEVYFVAALIITIAMDMPVIAYETYKFVDPALTDEERKMVYPFVTAASALFVVGLLFGFFILAKLLVIALAPFFIATQTSFLIDAAAFYYVVFLIVGATGVSFTTPVFVYTLIRLRVVDADFFSHNRVVLWFAIWVVTGLFLTPDGGPLLDLVIFVPVVSLFEVAVVLGRRSVSKKGSLPESPRCKYCSSKLTRETLFCPRCGKALG